MALVKTLVGYSLSAKGAQEETQDDDDKIYFRPSSSSSVSVSVSVCVWASGSLVRTCARCNRPVNSNEGYLKKCMRVHFLFALAISSGLWIWPERNRDGRGFELLFLPFCAVSRTRRQTCPTCFSQTRRFLLEYFSCFPPFSFGPLWLATFAFFLHFGRRLAA